MADRHLAPGPALLPVLVMLAVTALWGWTFVVVKDAISQYPAISFLAARFLLAAALMAVFAMRRLGDARLGLVIGGLLAVGYLAQTYGLTTVPASTAGLLTGMFVVFTPLCDRAFFGVATRRATLVAVAVSLAGMVAVTYGGSLRTGELLGDGLLVLCALAFAAHISFLSRYSPHHSTLGLAGWQMMACALVFGAGALGTSSVSAPPRAILPALLITGVGASAVAFLAQTYVQRRLDASRAALLLTAEPAFALLFGVVLAHDRLTPLRVCGAVLILGALAGHEAAVQSRTLELAPTGGP
ncbi:MAG: DMT family transporter [Candidatus Dormibacteria bacterium]